MKQANLYPDSAAWQIELDSVLVEFTLRRQVKRRHIGLRVDQHGLTVTAPTRSTESFIRRTLHDNADWILRKLKVWAKYRQPPIQWCDGETLPFLGDNVRLNVLAHPRSRAQIWMDLTGLVVTASRILEPDRVKEMVVDWYRDEARRYLPERLAVLAQRAKLPAPRFFLTNADGRWGSCNSKGDIRLNWRLMKATPAVIDYVAAHELAHLKYMDHSADFWRVVGQILPGYEAPRKELQQRDVFYRSF